MSEVDIRIDVSWQIARHIVETSEIGTLRTDYEYEVPLENGTNLVLTSEHGGKIDGE